MYSYTLVFHTCILLLSHANLPTPKVFFLSFMFVLKLKLCAHFLKSRLFYCPSGYRSQWKLWHLYLLIFCNRPIPAVFCSSATDWAGSTRKVNTLSILLWDWLNVPEMMERIYFVKKWKSEKKNNHHIISELSSLKPKIFKISFSAKCFNIH